MIDPAFLRLSSASNEDMLTDAAVHVIAERGAGGLTTSAVASWLRVTPQRVSQMVRRDDLPGVVAARFCTRWTDWLDDRRTLLGAACLVPDHGSQVAGVQMWLALGQISRGRPDVCEYVACARERERRLLVTLGLGLSARDIDLLLATAEGLRARICDPVTSLLPREAGATLGRLLTALGASVPDAA